MDNAELILEMIDQYNARSRDEIVNNLNIAVALGKAKGIAVDRYVALPKITGKSKHTVMPWFNRPNIKIPLHCLCMIADYLHYNIFAFFKTTKNGKVNTESFLIANDYCNEHYPRNSAKIYIEAYKLQKTTDKDIILDNLEKYYGTSEMMLQHHSNARQEAIKKVCGCETQTYLSWFNRSRKRVKIPLALLCKLAIDMDSEDSPVDIFDLFEQSE